LPEAIIDSHHHIWRLADVPWLAGPPVPRIVGDYRPLRRDYTVEEFIQDVAPHGVVKSVYAQVNVAPGREVDEVAWVQSNAELRGFPHAITGYADLADPQLGAALDRERAAGNLRAIRQQLHWHEKPLYRFAARPDLVNDATWRRGLAELARCDLAFEIQIFTSQMADAARLARDFPDVQFILLHAGMLEDRSEAGWAAWRTGMRALASCPNIAVKLSGLGTFEHRCSVALWRPVIEETLTFFSADRALFGSNFPIEKLWTSYGDLMEVVLECLSGLTSGERRAVLHDNAARIYGL
jgi:predicted TIM-barrel fold metal-dependent hydrolase